jgi:uncharacterized protein (TIGR03083 family)
MELTHEDHCVALEAGFTAFATTIRGADPQTPVPSCDPWLMRDLVWHVGALYHWVSTIVGGSWQERPPVRASDFPAPESAAEHPQWILDSGTAVVKILRDADPEAPVWSWGADRHIRFWPRRMRHETAIHRVDAGLALGRQVIVDDATALDGIDEFLTNLPMARWSPGVAELRGDGRRLALRATDAGTAWAITLEPEGFSWSRADGPAAVVVDGAAADLYTFLWGRLPASDGRLAITGDRDLVEFWVSHTAI